MTDNTTTPEPTDATSSRSSRLHTWITGHRLLAIAIAAAVLLAAGGATAGGIAWATHAAHQHALEQAREARAGATAAAEDLDTALDKLRDEAGAAIGYRDAVAAAIADADAYLGAETLPPVREALEQLTATLSEISTEDSTAETVTFITTPPAREIPRVDETASVTDLERLAEALEATAGEISDDVEEVTSDLHELADARAAIDDLLDKVADDLPTLADQLLAANGSASAESKDALAAALEQVAQTEAADDRPTALGEYVAAAKAVQAAHAAEEERKAQEQAQQPGGSGGNPGSGGGTPVDNNRYVQTNGNYVPFGSCTWATPYATHDPGPGGTSAPGYSFPWSYQNMGTYIQFYAC